MGNNNEGAMPAPLGGLSVREVMDEAGPPARVERAAAAAAAVTDDAGGRRGELRVAFGVSAVSLAVGAGGGFLLVVLLVRGMILFMTEV